MWIDSIKNNAEVKKVYKKCDPMLRDADLYYGIGIDGVTNTHKLYFEFRDWPSLLPADWVVEPLARVTIEFTLEKVHYNCSNLYGSFEHCNVSVEPLEAGGVRFVIKGENESLIDVEAQSVSISRFGYYNHKWD